MEYITVFKELLLQPSEFFTKMPRNENYFDPLIFAGICSIPGFILYVDKSYFVASYTGYLIGLIMRLFTNSLILHILWKVVGGTASFKNTFQIYAYSNVLEFFAALLGDLGWLLIPYLMYIRAKGGQFVHNLGLGRSLAVVIIVGIVELTQVIILSETTGLF